MRLATLRIDGGTRAARVLGDHAVFLPAADVGALLADPGWRELARPTVEEAVPLHEVAYAPLVPRPSKIICVGLNYRAHIEEMGRTLPTAPTLFAKFAESLIGAYDPLVLPAVSDQVDWEVELGVVVGQPVRRATVEAARDAIAGYTVLNDVSMRDWQNRTVEWLQGKTFEATTPVGPWLTTPDEVDHATDLELRCEVDGVVMQASRTSDLLFKPAELVAYISQIITLQPGDLIATGTPSGVGSGRDPKVFLQPGQTMRTVIEGLGECANVCLKEEA
jgi:acylpyruvate hydrolase